MKLYENAYGVRVYASSPNDASVAFCKEAAKLSLYLYETRKFNPEKVAFETVGKYFANVDPNTVYASGEQIVILNLNQDGQLIQPGGYGVLSPAAFEKYYKPVDNTQEPETPKNELAGKSFYLDAGHGGTDSGAVNDNLGLREKIAALEVCLKLGELLEAQGAKIYYSRTDNETYPSLTTRANDANAKNVTAFISIHLNSAENKTAQGIETLVYALNGTACELALKVQENMVAATGWTNRGVKARPELTVLKKTKMPAILCEIGFISNDAQAKELFKAATQEKIADAIANGVIEQFSE